MAWRHLQHSTRVDKWCQTPKELFQQTGNQQQKIEIEQLKQQLERERNQHRRELRKAKKKQWCSVCAEEGI